MKEYTKKYRNGEEIGDVDLNKLKAKRLPSDIYEQKHKGSVLSCHDIFIEYEGGVLLVRREKEPAKGELWPIGGEIKRGMLFEDSLRKKVYEECRLNELDDIVYLGFGRPFFNEDPFSHGKGTDALGLVYFGRGKGNIELDENHSHQTIITPREYSDYRTRLHEYVRDFMDIVMPLVEGKPKGDELQKQVAFKRLYKEYGINCKEFDIN